ncbi:MAG: hypothetical protein SWZ49_21600 [Cyanobacteriota bacterium]|nr:hypothetical protein [Cyanobacteriota bacterium]
MKYSFNNSHFIKRLLINVHRLVSEVKFLHQAGSYLEIGMQQAQTFAGREQQTEKLPNSAIKLL